MFSGLKSTFRGKCRNSEWLYFDLDFVAGAWCLVYVLVWCEVQNQNPELLTDTRLVLRAWYFAKASLWQLERAFGNDYIYI